LPQAFATALDELGCPIAIAISLYDLVCPLGIFLSCDQTFF